ncbi:hypothetical protein EYF80_043876 [Liparis tanakae]|uniref:Uncharacterized protein n=1 Tax=Liparis tanakae TaxID=230148 RepID=A0A4Z2FXG0_9TELE|nr:hypothetical protein EYF80_043876 [Liparis tanakae]
MERLASYVDFTPYVSSLNLNISLASQPLDWRREADVKDGSKFSPFPFPSHLWRTFSRFSPFTRDELMEVSVNVLVTSDGEVQVHVAARHGDQVTGAEDHHVGDVLNLGRRGLASFLLLSSSSSSSSIALFVHSVHSQLTLAADTRGTGSILQLSSGQEVLVSFIYLRAQSLEDSFVRGSVLHPHVTGGALKEHDTPGPAPGPAPRTPRSFGLSPECLHGLAPPLAPPPGHPVASGSALSVYTAWPRPWPRPQDTP